MNRITSCHKILRGAANACAAVCSAGAVTVFIFLFAIVAGCRQDHLPSPSTGGTDYQQVNLVADTLGYSASRIDTNLTNAWGIAISPKGNIWISCNHTGQTVIYDVNGNQTLAPVAIPLKGAHYGAAPAGVVYNSTTDFMVNGKPAKYIYATENGIISAWNTGDSTITVADRSAANVVYKGITIANDGTGNFLYVTDFHNGRIDVYDRSFNYVTNKPFADTSIPMGFAPFNIRNIGGKLFVAYAKQMAPDNHDDQGGLGNGYINVFDTRGNFVKRFTGNVPLNSPWGMIPVPNGFGQASNAILIANYGDGRINVFDTTGTLIGPLGNNGTPISIDGLWDIAFSSTSNTQLFFTAGPDHENHGLFGYLIVK